MPPGLFPYLVLGTGLMLSLVATMGFTVVVRKMALRYRWMDQPDNDRKQHEQSTPVLGGLAIAAGFGVGLVYLLTFRDLLPFNVNPPSLIFTVGALVMIAAGLFDDIRGLNFKAKFLLQVIAGYILLHAGYRIDVSGIPFIDSDPYYQALYSIPLTLIWIVGIINAVNLIDGLDGLASGVVVAAFAAFAAIFSAHGDVGSVVIAVAMVGALLGFLKYNFYPASIFMGDTGSLFLGYMLAAFSLWNPTHADPWLAMSIPVVVLGVPVADTGMAIVRRLLGGQAICAPDHDHIHHRMFRCWSQPQAVLALYAVALWLGISALLSSLVSATVGYMVLGTTLLMAYTGLHMLGYLHARVMWRQLQQRYELRVREASAKATEEKHTEPVAETNGEAGVERRRELVHVES